MKRLFVIRHAKSDHGPQYKSDFERSLNKSGQREARLMASELKKSINSIDLAIASQAVRTRETAGYFINEFNVDPSHITYTRELYLPVEEEIWAEIRKIRGNYSTIAVFTHNPAVQELLNRYKPGTRTPTCSVIELQYDGREWHDISPFDVRLISHKYPKLYA